MKARQLVAVCAGLLALSGGTALAQQGPYVSQRMYVIVTFNLDRDPWDYAAQIARAASMSLLGVSPATHAAVYAVPAETDMATGAVAAQNQRIILSKFPGTVASYAYGANYPLPTDLQQRPMAIQPPWPAQPQPPMRPAPEVERGQEYVRSPSAYDRGGQPEERITRPSAAQYRLTNRDRETVQDWFEQNYELTRRLQVGTVLDQSLKDQSYAPSDLVRRLPPVPPDHRILIIADYLVVVDGRDYIQDFVQFVPR